jgi:hypothetical protein
LIFLTNTPLANTNIAAANNVNVYPKSRTLKIINFLVDKFIFPVVIKACFLFQHKPRSGAFE